MSPKFDWFGHGRDEGQKLVDPPRRGTGPRIVPRLSSFKLTGRKEAPRLLEAGVCYCQPTADIRNSTEQSVSVEPAGGCFYLFVKWVSGVFWWRVGL